MQHDFQGDVARRDRFPREAAFRGTGEVHTPIDVAGRDGRGGRRPDQLLVSDPQLIILANFIPIEVRKASGRCGHDEVLRR